MVQKLFNKFEAAELLGIKVSKLHYHRYQSGKFPKGRRNKYGVLEWTKAELDKFAELDIKPGYQQRPGVKVITPSGFASLSKDEVATYHGRRVVKCERSYNHSREWILTYEDNTPDYVWNNVRLEVRKGGAV